MKRNIFKKIFDFIFPVEDDSEKIFNLLKNRVIYYPKIRTIYFLPYSNALVRKSILDIKFNKKFRSSTIFAEIIYQNLPDILIDLKIREDFNEPVLVNIPISFLRKISRGYDQNNLIIKQFYALGGKNFIN
jgi:predicted amidophosphoribosyltransferase